MSHFKESIIFAASFNPPTIAHLRIIQALSKQFHVHAVIAVNSQKQYELSSHQRQRLLTKALIDQGTSAQTHIMGKGWLVDFAVALGVNRFARGYRNWKEWLYESGMDLINRSVGVFRLKLFKPVLLVHLGDLKGVSSTKARSALKENKREALKDLLPSVIIGDVTNCYLEE